MQQTLIRLKQVLVSDLKTLRRQHRIMVTMLGIIHLSEV